MVTSGADACRGAAVHDLTSGQCSTTSSTLRLTGTPPPPEQPSRLASTTVAAHRSIAARATLMTASHPQVTVNDIESEQPGPPSVTVSVIVTVAFEAGHVNV